ncbi:hypothetical protein DSM3645_03188 [Blastopirellula marina DSM 3645]|uniref:Uncharacterized protein n=1 Tax=Blastopirellula marina DSM 3645 TaxID=314230 RepID=A3ZVV1_9BACT|nr:hypothetical protein DSM3645_03188 [Blastopirellula marina DSM 3645]
MITRPSFVFSARLFRTSLTDSMAHTSL